MVCECETLATGAQRLGRDICSILCTRRAALASCMHPRDSQLSSKDAIQVFALRSVTVPARDPAVAEMKRGPRIREAVDGGGDRHALRAEYEGKKKRTHHLAGRSKRGGKEFGTRSGEPCSVVSVGTGNMGSI